MPDDANPFSANRIRPGALAYIFPPGESADSLVCRLASLGWNGAIVGPHGSGKSTLLQALIPACRQAGRDIAPFVLRGGERELPLEPQDAPPWSRTSLIVVDGFEQLGWVARIRLASRLRYYGAGLLATCHRDPRFPLRLPILVRTAPDAATIRSIVIGLLGENDPVLSIEEALANLLARLPDVQGNLREALFSLYDLYESRRRQLQKGAELP